MRIISLSQSVPVNFSSLQKTIRLSQYIHRNDQHIIIIIQTESASYMLLHLYCECVLRHSFLILSLKNLLVTTQNHYDSLLGVGKSCILTRLTKDKFDTEHNVTVGVDFGSCCLKVEESNLKLQIWDTAG